MQVVVALAALPLVALILALVSRLEDGLRAPASAPADGSPLALPPGPLAVAAAADAVVERVVEGIGTLGEQAEAA